MSEKPFVIQILPLILLGIGLAAFLGYSIHNQIQTDHEIKQMDCNELWERMEQNFEEVNSVGSKAFSTWIMKECWS